MDDRPANQVSLHVPWMYRVAYRLLADADRAGKQREHETLSHEWTARLRADLTPFLEAPLPANYDGPRTDLAQAILLLEDATDAELKAAYAAISDTSAAH